jgi:rSAM/selenodomain-associated transferase 1
MHKIPVDGGLIVFLRLPQWGKVKTRLASTMGQDVALSIYRKLISRTLTAASESGYAVYLFYEGGLPSLEERNPAFSYHIQSSGDLGKKIVEAISYVLQFHTKAVIIGSDCPLLSSSILKESFIALDTNDVVLGPAMDGGYYLFGCKNLYTSVFDDIQWSSPSVLEQTIEKIIAASLRYHLLTPLSDIDTEEDWIRYKDSGN